MTCAASAQSAVATGDAVGKSDAIDGSHAAYTVEGQNDETWYRKNVRPVLREYGTYSPSDHGYRVTEADLPTVDADSTQINADAEGEDTEGDR